MKVRFSYKCIVDSYFLFKQIDETNKLNEAGLRNYFNEIPFADYLQRTLENVISKCIEEYRTMETESKNASTEPNECKTDIAAVWTCVYDGLKSSCPPEHQENSDRCEDP